MCAIIDNERGVGVAAALLFVLILAALGYVSMALVIEDLSGAGACVDSELALGVAQAGLQFGTARLVADAAWTGVALPGKPVGRGAFVVAVTTTDESGAPLPGGQKMVRSTGRVGNAVRQVRQLVTPGGGSSGRVFATSQGNAVSIGPLARFLNIGNVIDDPTGPNNTWSTGTFDPDLFGRGIFAGWTNPGLGGSITDVEVFLYGYVSSALVNDETDLRVYWNGHPVGTTYTLTTAELNTHAGAASADYWYIDVNGARSWNLSDFTGDLELYVCNDLTGFNDLRFLFLDAVGFRITTTGGGGGGTATAFKEITT